MQGAGVQGASISVDRKSMGHRVGERWWKNVVFVYLAWLLWYSVLRLAVRGKLFPVVLFGVRGGQYL
jgi:hypothetical protein